MIVLGGGGVQKHINASPHYKRVFSLCGFRETFRGKGQWELFTAILIILLEPLDGGSDTLLHVGELEIRVGLA